MAHQLTLSLKRKQNPRGILMKVKRDGSLSHRHTLYLKNGTKLVCSCTSNRKSKRLNLKQSEYVVFVEGILYRKKYLGAPMKIHSVLIDRPVVFTLRGGDYILGNKYAALWECDCLASKIKAEAWERR